jgi:hypothetical protein
MNTLSKRAEGMAGAERRRGGSFGRSGSRLYGSAWGASRLPSAPLRRFAVLTRPGALPVLAFTGATRDQRRPCSGQQIRWLE